ncbi:hypothetical protein D3C80_1234690 [compost metagenome]
MRLDDKTDLRKRRRRLPQMTLEGLAEAVVVEVPVEVLEHPDRRADVPPPLRDVGKGAACMRQA